MTLFQLIKKYQKATRSTFYPMPFLPLELLKKRGLVFNEVLQNETAMTEAALLSFELGFESTVLPFDMNVEAEILGADVAYHEGFDGNPVYPTIISRPVECSADIIIPENLQTRGRMPAILEAIREIKTSAPDQGAVGAFMPGPLTLAGQVLEPEILFTMLIKNPGQAGKILDRLTKFLKALKRIYVTAGIDFILVEEGGASSISPKIFRSLLLSRLQDLFNNKPVPHIISLAGGSTRIIPLLLSCCPDGIGLDQNYDLSAARVEIPESVPFFAICGDHELLAHAPLDVITKTVRNCLAQGADTIGPPADIYPPAKTENIRAFLAAIREYAV